MITRMFTVGGFLTNCYVVSCEQTKKAIIMDPGFDNRFEAQKIFSYLVGNALEMKLVLNTHGHPDHTSGNGIVKEKFNVPIYIHKGDAHMLGKTGKNIAGFFGLKSSSPPADKLLQDGDLVNFGRTQLKVMCTPGHSRGSISLLGGKEVFTGDTLFSGSIGRADFTDSSERDMKFSLKKLAYLPDHFIVYPGHGPTTTIGEEKRNNPFLQWL